MFDADHSKTRSQVYTNTEEEHLNSRTQAQLPKVVSEMIIGCLNLMMNISPGFVYVKQVKLGSNQGSEGKVHLLSEHAPALRSCIFPLLLPQ